MCIPRSENPEDHDLQAAVLDAMHRLGLKKGKEPVETLTIDHIREAFGELASAELPQHGVSVKTPQQKPKDETSCQRRPPSVTDAAPEEIEC